MFRSSIVLGVLCLVISGCSTGSDSRFIMPIKTSVVRGGVRLTVAADGGKIDPHHVRVVVRIANESRHAIDVYSYPVSCAVPEGNPTVFVSNSRGQILNRPTPSLAACPYPGGRTLLPQRALQRTVVVDLGGTWLQGVVILSSATGRQHRIKTRRIHVVYAATL